MKIKSLLQPFVSGVWYAAHPKQASAKVRKSFGVLPPDEKLWERFTGYDTYTNKPVNELTLFQISASWSAIRLISETIGTLPIHLYRRTEKGREKARDHDLYWVLHQQPNAFMTPTDFAEAIAVSLCCFGQSYNKIERVGKRVVSILPVFKPDVSVRIENGYPQYKLTLNGLQQDITQADICPIRGFGRSGFGRNDRIEGMPPFLLARNSLALAAAVEEYGARFFGNGAIPGGALVFEDWLDPEQRKLAREKFAKMHQGLENAHELAVLEGGTKYVPFGAKNNEGQMTETRAFQVIEVARWFRVPPHMLMDASRATYNNSETENLHFLKYTLRPYLVRIEQSLNRYLLTPLERRKGYYIQFSVEGLLRGDSLSRAQYIKTQRESGVITINEAREMENLPKIDGGDDVHVPLNYSPLDLLRNSVAGEQDAKD